MSMKKITVVIHSTDVRSAEGHIAQVAAALSRGDDAMALLAPRRRMVPFGPDGAAKSHEVLERVEYWSEDVGETPTGPPTWGRDRKAASDDAWSPTRDRVMEAGQFERVFLPFVQGLKAEAMFEWARRDDGNYLVYAISVRAQRLLGAV